MKNQKPEKLDLSNIPLEKIIGYKPTEMTEKQAKKYNEKIEYLEYLGIIGTLDGDETPKMEADRWRASCLIEMGKPVPQDLIDRLLSYKNKT